MAKNDKIKLEKEALCLKLLKANPSASMKEVNEEVRKDFDSGVAAVVFSRLKKELSTDSVAIESDKKVATKAKPKPKAKPKSKKKAEEISVKLEETPSDKAENIEVKNASIKEDVSLDKPEKNKNAALEVETKEPEPEKEPEIEEEPEIPVEKYPFNIKIQIPNASTVFIAGSFNKWKKDEYRLEKEEGDWWVYDDKLPEGSHNYKFIVNSREWYVDFDSEIVTDDTGVSNTLVVEPT